MSVRIRLARGGAKKRPFHKIVVADKRSPRDGRFIEAIGFYNPLLPKDHADALRVDVEAAKKWMAAGAEMTERVQKLFAIVGLCDKPAVRETPKKSAPKAKAQERMKEAAERPPPLKKPVKLPRKKPKPLPKPNRRLPKHRPNSQGSPICPTRSASVKLSMSMGLKAWSRFALTSPDRWISAHSDRSRIKTEIGFLRLKRSAVKVILFWRPLKASATEHRLNL